MIRHMGAALAAAVCLSAAGAAFAQAPTEAHVGPASAAPPPVNYVSPDSWLCWPGAKPNACETDLATTVVEPGGTTRVEPFHPAADPKIDCFYVYPTVSTDPGLLATMAKEPAETGVVKQQFARFAASCRLYAPVYRQFTLTALVAAMSGHPLAGSGGARPTTPYEDVRDAWNYYLAHANKGRGVVLIGHSQGSGVLSELIKREIDGKPVQKKLVSAILMGSVVAVPAGADVGGDFKTIPLCHASSQTGCVIVYASFRDTLPPPADSRFGRPRTPGDTRVAACVNPANLSGGEGELHAYLASGTDMIVASSAPPPQWAKGKSVTTPFVSLPGMLTARCVSTAQFNYLAVHVNPDHSGGRASDINGDVVIGGKVQGDWGLHLIDANLAMGNLVAVVGDQARAWSAQPH